MKVNLEKFQNSNEIKKFFRETLCIHKKHIQIKMIYTKQNIQSIIIQNKTPIQQFGTKRLGLFGSHSRNEQTDKSDLDFVVEFHKTQKNYKNFIHLCYFLEDIFGKKVDLLTLESLPHDRKFTENVLNDVMFIIKK